MTLHRLTLGDYQVNCYILANGDRCLIVDPGYSPERIQAFLAQQGLTPEAILLTHGHFDHVGGVQALAQETGCRVWIHERERALPSWLTAGPIPCTDFYQEGAYSLAGLDFRVLETPGHSPGSVCLQFADCLLSGDTLFAGSCGRTDLPGGDETAMEQSLARLAALSGDCPVYPGHGPSTTLERERRQNPFLRGSL